MQVEDNFILLFRLYISMLIDSLNEYTYHAEVAGLSYYLSIQSSGLMVRQKKCCARLNSHMAFYS